jgi:hypothetical protein
MKASTLFLGPGLNMAVERRRPRHLRPEGGQGGVREVTIASALFISARHSTSPGAGHNPNPLLAAAGESFRVVFKRSHKDGGYCNALCLSLDDKPK